MSWAHTLKGLLGEADALLAQLAAEPQSAKGSALIQLLRVLLARAHGIASRNAAPSHVSRRQ